MNRDWVGEVVALFRSWQANGLGYCMTAFVKTEEETKAVSLDRRFLLSHIDDQLRSEILRQVDKRGGV